MLVERRGEKNCSEEVLSEECIAVQEGVPVLVYSSAVQLRQGGQYNSS
jgi:hypothetical protein